MSIMNMNCHPHLVPSACPIRSSDTSRLTSPRSTRPPPRTPESAWTKRKNRRPSPPAQSSPLPPPPPPPAWPPACVHLDPPPRRTRSARVRTLHRDRHDDPVRSLRYRSPGRRRGSTIGTATARQPSAVVVVVRHPEHTRPNNPVVYPVCKVNEGRRVNPPPPPPLKSHPPGRRLTYCGQEQPIAAQAARWRMTENAIIIVVAITRGQAESEVRSQEVVEPPGLRPSSSFIIVVVVVVGIVVIVVVAETPPADGRRPIDGSPLTLVRCIGMCSTTTMPASSSSSSSSLSSQR